MGFWITQKIPTLSQYVGCRNAALYETTVNDGDFTLTK
jgi:hypothetical protein